MVLRNRADVFSRLDPVLDGNHLSDSQLQILVSIWWRFILEEEFVIKKILIIVVFVCSEVLLKHL